MTETKQATIPVSMRALIQRLNRRLKADNEVLKTTRGARAVASIGRFYICNSKRNWITRTNVDPEALARELGILSAWEHVEDGP